MMTYSHHETAVDTLSGHTLSGHTLHARSPLAIIVARCARCLCAARCVSAVCCCCCPCGLLCVFGCSARIFARMCFVAPWWSAYTCILKSNDPTLKSSLAEDTHANYFFFMGAYIARPRCNLETRFARTIIVIVIIIRIGSREHRREV